jgi:hypothetical protein
MNFVIESMPSYFWEMVLERAFHKFDIKCAWGNYLTHSWRKIAFESHFLVFVVCSRFPSQNLSLFIQGKMEKTVDCEDPKCPSMRRSIVNGFTRSQRCKTSSWMTNRRISNWTIIRKLTFVQIVRSMSGVQICDGCILIRHWSNLWRKSNLYLGNLVVKMKRLEMSLILIWKIRSVRDISSTFSECSDQSWLFQRHRSILICFVKSVFIFSTNCKIRTDLPFLSEISIDILVKSHFHFQFPITKLLFQPIPSLSCILERSSSSIWLPPLTFENVILCILLSNTLVHSDRSRFWFLSQISELCSQWHCED